MPDDWRLGSGKRDGSAHGLSDVSRQAALVRQPVRFRYKANDRLVSSRDRSAPVELVHVHAATVGASR